MKKLNLNISLITIIIFLAAATRIFPHPPNFSPIMAIGIFGAAHFTRKWYAFLIPLVAIWLSDMVINNLIYSSSSNQFIWFYSGFYWQYFSYIIIILTGVMIFRNKISISKTFGASISSSAIFFIISNFGVWFGSSMYPKNLSGLATCYAAGIPFLHNTILSNVLFTTVLFGSYFLIQTQYSTINDKNLQYS